MLATAAIIGVACLLTVLVKFMMSSSSVICKEVENRELELSQQKVSIYIEAFSQHFSDLSFFCPNIYNSTLHLSFPIIYVTFDQHKS